MPRLRNLPRGLLVAALAGCFLALTPRPAAAMPPPTPPRGPIPPCASGPGGLIGCIPSPGATCSAAPPVPPAAG